MDKGLLIKPTENPLQLDLHVDADFCGLFGQEDPSTDKLARTLVSSDRPSIVQVMRAM